jgi:hypothetical protein
MATIKPVKPGTAAPATDDKPTATTRNTRLIAANENATIRTTRGINENATTRTTRAMNENVGTRITR